MNHYASKVETKNWILQTTLHILVTEGIQKLTVRKIAAQAGVNPADLNYCFGSKGQVVLKRSRHCVPF